MEGKVLTTGLQGSPLSSSREFPKMSERFCEKEIQFSARAVADKSTFREWKNLEFEINRYILLSIN